ncbi:zona pellucida sperm-binding protein 4-like isoform X1 [Amia ocellicauda]|uniref:zona pellucida sperm-binding protein 4-like isoform X1 n=1 Tax=Amia ocellicauda TaxID=2972642 RepID=UPI0034639FFF
MSVVSVWGWVRVCLRLVVIVVVSLAQDQKCVVSDNEKIACGDTAINSTACAANNCCFAQGGRLPCYYSNEVTVQCTEDGQFVVVVPRNVTTPPLSLGTVTLLEGQSAPCSPVGTTASFALFQFPVSACGSTFKTEGGDLVYENLLSSAFEVQKAPDGSITRDSYYELSFQCKYSASELVPVGIIVEPVAQSASIVALGPLIVELRIATGTVTSLLHGNVKQMASNACGLPKATLCSSVEAVYDSYYLDADYPVTKVLQDPVYVEVRILNRTDPNIVLTLEDCWATSTPSPLSQPQWSLLVDGCPYRDDDYQTTLIPVGSSSGLPYPTHYKRFVMQMFTFVDAGSQLPLNETVFIHCSAAVCRPNVTDSCVAQCNRRMRRAVAPVPRASRESVVVSSGEVVLTAPERSAVDRRVSSSEVPQAFSYGVLGLTASSVLVLCALVLAAVWRARPQTLETQL